ncbi:MAG TPA: hypothetical protein VFJ19_11740 [Nocardioidaceae bacterium]|nr:hypothetical protein [Nocardioidaceae bacterium]
MSESPAAAFYARRGGPLADWWTLLHPPYTVWHLSYVVLGAAMAPARDWASLGLGLAAFFLALGVSAHALDELTGRPLGTSISDGALRSVGVLALAGAVVIGIIGVFFWPSPVNWPVLVAVPIGVMLVVGYNLELFGGRLHTDAAFALAWGGFPVAVGYLAQSPPFHARDIVAAACAVLTGVGTSAAQRALSTPARRLRRRTFAVEGTVTSDDGSVAPVDRAFLLAPAEGALRALSWAVPLVAVAALLAGS